MHQLHFFFFFFGKLHQLQFKRACTLYSYIIFLCVSYIYLSNMCTCWCFIKKCMVVVLIRSRKDSDLGFELKLSSIDTLFCTYLDAQILIPPLLHCLPSKKLFLFLIVSLIVFVANLTRKLFWAKEIKWQQYLELFAKLRKPQKLHQNCLKNGIIAPHHK